ncbi:MULTISPECIES: TraY domain-containing protein [Pseudomonas]|uniref:Relaxosome protein TraY n=1 Tax=Pseudomonas rhodesiae TaxID=76760 RepID=A0A8I1EAM7_9PSED|nr:MULTISPECIES: TraY domain-containing protein [Pseudomonas]MBI6605163.1 TraY domain-containing protein [Pseudomonas sp. S4_EA_1b]MBI6628171.1 TraY domain-containing protein [Pseudomonas rhodesiae]
MSKEELQVNFRMPASLKAELERAAKESGRSLTAEVVARLNLTMLTEDDSGESLIPAKQAQQMSAIARQSIPSTMKKRIFQAINQAVAMGHGSAKADFADLQLESIPQADMDKLFEAFSKMLSDAGYRYEWDGPENLWIDFDEL